MAHKCDGCRYKGQHSEMMFCPFGVCTKELNLLDAEKAYNAEVCPHKNHCVFCGEEIPADKEYCGICSAFADSLDPNQLKALETITKDEEARAKFAASILEIKLRLKMAIAPVVEAICDFIDRTMEAINKEVDK